MNWRRSVLYSYLVEKKMTLLDAWSRLSTKGHGDRPDKKGQEQNDETWQEKCDVTKEKQRKRNVKTTVYATSFLTAKRQAEVLGQITQGNLSPDASCENFVNNRGGFESSGLSGRWIKMSGGPSPARIAFGNCFRRSFCHTRQVSAWSQIAELSFQKRKLPLFIIFLCFLWLLLLKEYILSVDVELSITL